MQDFVFKSAGLLCAWVLVSLQAAPACAALEIRVEPETTLSSAGADGSFLVVLTNTDTVELSSFQFSVHLGGTGVQFTDADTQTSVVDDSLIDVPYVFEGVSFVEITGFPLTLSFSANELTLNDAVLDPRFPDYDPINDPLPDPPFQSYVTLSPGSYGLARIKFVVDQSAASGSRSVTLSDPLFEDGSFTPIPLTDITLRNGKIVVEGIAGAPIVPEPGTLSMFLAGGGLIAGCVMRRRGRRIAAA